MARERQALEAERLKQAAIDARTRWTRENLNRRVVSEDLLKHNAVLQFQKRKAAEAEAKAKGNGDADGGENAGRDDALFDDLAAEDDALTLVGPVDAPTATHRGRSAHAGGAATVSSAQVPAEEVKQEHPFKGCIVAPNGAALWGKSVVQVALADSIAFALTSMGTVEVWGGHSAWWYHPKQWGPQDTAKRKLALMSPPASTTSNGSPGSRSNASRRSRASRRGGKGSLRQQAMADDRLRGVPNSTTKVGEPGIGQASAPPGTPEMRGGASEAAASATSTPGSARRSGVAPGSRVLLTPRSSLLKTTSVGGYWSGRTKHELLQEVGVSFGA